MQCSFDVRCEKSFSIKLYDVTCPLFWYEEGYDIVMKQAVDNMVLVYNFQ